MSDIEGTLHSEIIDVTGEYGRWWKSLDSKVWVISYNLVSHVGQCNRFPAKGRRHSGHIIQLDLIIRLREALKKRVFCTLNVIWVVQCASHFPETNGHRVYSEYPAWCT